MKVISTAINDVLLIQPELFADHRGFFMESYNADKFAKINIPHVFIQDNHSLSLEAGVL